MRTWTKRDESKLEYLGLIEFKINNEWHNFEIMHDNEYVVFGSATNTGFLQSGYMLKDEFLALDENLQQLLEELETYYHLGKEYCSSIVTNERM
jgi:hypothetical protein